MTRLRLRGVAPAHFVRERDLAAAFPLGEAPQVAAHAGRVELAADEVHVGAADHAILVGGERHPLGEHVVGGGQAVPPAAPVRSGNSTQYSLQQLATPRDVGDDRLVRVDQVGVGGGVGGPAVGLAPGVLAADPDEAEVAVHGPLLVVDARAQQLAGALLGAALAAGVVERSSSSGPTRAARRRAPGAPRLGLAHDQRGRQDESDQCEGEQCQQHVSAASAAGGAREEDHPVGVSAGCRRSS